MSDLHVPAHPVRFVTAASLFDGHDAAINIMRRILQRQGAEVVHLGHNRSVDEVVAAAIQEDAQGVAISSYQGGHVEYFSYLVELLRERGAGHIRVYGGGGGVIVPREIELLHERGVARIFSPEDGQRLGLPGMINLMIRECDVDLAAQPPASFDDLYTGDTATLARTLTLAETGHLPADLDRTPPPAPSPCSASPAPADPGSPRSPTSWCAASGSTRRTSSASPCSPSTPPGARAAARCSATGSA